MGNQEREETIRGPILDQIREQRQTGYAKDRGVRSRGVGHRESELSIVVAKNERRFAAGRTTLISSPRASEIETASQANTRARSCRAGKQLIRPGRVYSLGRGPAGITEYPIGAIEDEMMQIHESPRPTESGNEMVEDILYEGSVSARNPR